MKFIGILFLLPMLALSHGDDMYLIKGGKVFLPDDGFVVKDILVDDGKIIMISDDIGDIDTGEVINAQGKYVTPGLMVFSSLG